MAAESPKELFLIDGNSLVYRAFFALPESIATSKGQPTNAIFGFASMLVKIISEYGVKPTLVVWDAGMSGRKEVYAEYKGQRDSKPDLLAEQWPHMEPLVDSFGYENVRVEGYEADDVIATVARRARDEGFDVMVVTGDRDLFQLIEPGVRVMATSRGITDTKVYDHDAVVDRYGIEPELIPDFVGLKGDTSDNIPGVPGIGEKTASQLLQEHGDLEGVLGNIENISGAKRKENLTNHAEDARISKQLATAIRDIELDLDLDTIAAREPDRSRLRETFREFELRAPLERLEEALGDGEVAAPAERVEEVISVRAREVPLAELGSLDGELVAIAAERPRPAGEQEGQETLDVGGPPIGPMRIAAYGGGEVLVAECETLAALTMARGERPIVYHDWKTTAVSEEAAPAAVLEHDTMIAAYLIDPARRGYPLDELTTEAGIAASVDGADGIAERAVVTRVLAERQRARLEEDGLTGLFHEVELPLVDVLVEMERAGVKLDVERLAEISERFGARGAELEQRVWDLAGEEFTIGSPQQLGADPVREARALAQAPRQDRLLHRRARAPGDPRRARDHPGDRGVARGHQAQVDLPGRLPRADRRRRPPAHDLQPDRHRHGTPVQHRPEPPEHPDPHRAGPRDPRAASWRSRGNMLISADYSQVELRLLAHIADEPVLKEIFRRGEDVHTATAEAILGQARRTRAPAPRRRWSTTGSSTACRRIGLADRLQIEQEEAQQFIDAYLERFPRVKAFIEKTIERAREEGHVTTLFGRIRRVPELRSRQFQTRSLGERLAVNMVIQGTAADIIKMAMVRARDELRTAGLSTRLVLQIHDELLFEGPEAEVPAASEIIEREMAEAFEMDPPLGVDVGVGKNWLEAK